MVKFLVTSVVVLICLFLMALLLCLMVWVIILMTERPANESQVGISRFQFRKKATRSQTAERSKIETAVGQRGVQYEIRSAPVCLDKQLPRRSRYAGTCWQKPSCRPCKAFLRNAFCP